jgi:hypothetical protein
MTETLSNGLTKFWDFLDTRGVIRRVVLGIAIYMLWVQANWANEYALTALALGKSDASIAAIVAAISAPATMLVGYVFKNYLDSRAT